MSRKLIIGYDGERTSEDALVLGRLLAEVLDAKPMVVAVFPYPDHLLDPANRERVLSTLGQPVFDVAVDRLQPLECETHAVADDSPAHALHELAEAEGPIAVVLGSAHRGPLGRLFIGSVGQSLLSGAPCSIAVAPRGFADRRELSLQRIGVGLNGSPESWRAFDAGVALASRLHARLEGLTATPAAGPDLPGAILSMLSAEEAESAQEHEMRDVLREAETKAPAELGVRGRLLLHEGVNGLVKASERVDLLIVGSRGYGPVRRALLGSTSSELVRSVSVPILVLPRASGPDPLGLAEGSALQGQKGQDG
jgi:nucleotide-binding universal stress UspA family protein